MMYVLFLVAAVLLPALTSVPAERREVYSNNFESGTTAQWTTPAAGNGQTPVRISTTPDGKRRYLGDFGTQSVQLALDRLPPHDTLFLAFDLFIIRSWDGNTDPDLWELRIDDTLLLATTFSNVTFPQAFPGSYPGTHHAERTGAIAGNSLGFTWSEPGVYNGPLDALYRIEVAVPHTAPAAALKFAARLRDVRPIPANESWGLDNVVVHVSAPEPREQPGGPSPGGPLPGATPAAADTIPQYDLSDVVISMRRGACFGRCPIYSVTIYGSGRVEYMGVKFVEVEGAQVDTIPQAAVNALLHALHTRGFFAMQERYDNRHITDLPATTTTVQTGETTKSVYNYFGAPQELRALERLIDSTAQTDRWIDGRR